MQFDNRSLHESYLKIFHSFYSQQRWDLQGVAVDVVSCDMEPRSVQSTQRREIFCYSNLLIFRLLPFESAFKSTCTKSGSISNSNTCNMYCESP